MLHCAVRGGHVNTLQWLVSVLGSQCTEAALNDNNQAGRTVILTALKVSSPIFLILLPTVRSFPFLHKLVLHALKIIKCTLFNSVARTLR